jgi:hypothetical protein
LTSDDPTYTELAHSFADIAQLLFVERTVQGTLQRIVDFAKATIDDCDAASISMMVNGELATSVFSDSIALDIDQFQYHYDEGPCLDALRTEPLLYCSDMTSDARWPTFGPMAVGLGMRSLLACRLGSTTTLGALNLYSRLPEAYDELERTKAVIFASHAGIALGAAGDLHDLTLLLNAEIARSQNLEGAIASRQVIGQAEGILIERERITAHEAYDVLKRTSQHLNLKLREVAQYVVDTGEVPTS